MPLGIQIENNPNNINTRIKLQSFRALKWYLNEKNLKHGRKTTTVQKFTEQNNKSYYNMLLLTNCEAIRENIRTEVLKYGPNKVNIFPYGPN